MFFRKNKTSDNSVLIVGLGNPGTEYQNSRHNCGFMALDHIQPKLDNLPSFKQKHKAMLSACTSEYGRLILAYPTTFMNASGQSVSELLAYYKLSPKQLIVIYDDIDLPLGALRVRASGRPGTHNGMRSIVSNIGQDFSRIRIGIGKPPAQMDLANYVLAKFSPAELTQMQNTFDRAADCALEFARSGIDKAMAKYNIKESL